MDVRFQDLELARICNSRQELEASCGLQPGRLLQRRLWDIAACEDAGLARLPDTRVRSTSRGTAELQFGEEVVVRGVITPCAGSTGEGEILITSVTINGSELQ